MTSNPLLDDIIETGAIPTVEIGLPTSGVFYYPGEVLVEGTDPDSVAINSISILDESAFRDPLLMLSGTALIKMIKHVVPSVINPADLCELDVQAILIGCRMATYGSKMQMTTVCPSCSESSDIEIDLLEHIQRYGAFASDQLDKFNVDLPRVKQKARLRPMLYKDSVTMMMAAIRANQSIDEYRSADAEGEKLSDEFLEVYAATFQKTLDTNVTALVSGIQSVFTSKGVEVQDRQVIHEWVVKLTPIDVNIIKSRIMEINSAIRDLAKLDYECQHCHKPNHFYLELDPQKLFTPAEPLTTDQSSSAKSTNTGKTTKTRSRISQK